MNCSGKSRPGREVAGAKLFGRMGPSGVARATGLRAAPAGGLFCITALLLAAALSVLAPGLAAGADSKEAPSGAGPLVMVVMDPLCNRLACDCVAGYARRDYERLAAAVGQRLHRPVQVVYAESLCSPAAGDLDRVDVVIGKFSTVRYDAARRNLTVRPVAMLTGPDGEMTLTGLFVVRREHRARSIEDLSGCRLLFGPEDSDETRSAAFAALEAFAVPLPQRIESKGGCSSAALAVVEGDADAAVISSYAMPLLTGCGTIGQGELRVIGQTDPVPFISLFVTDRVEAALEAALVQALPGAADDPELLAALESKYGFVPLGAVAGCGSDGALGWPDWRGPNRDGRSLDVPKTLPRRKQLLWSRTLTGAGMSGLAVAGGLVIVADKSLDETEDIFRALDADTGRQRWAIRYRADGEMDFTNSPRATPVVCDGLVYLLGAFGHLHCVRLETGEVVWRRHLASDFNARRPTWGYCSTPLVVEDLLIVNPGAKDASLVALDRRTGQERWRAAGEPAGYGSFVLAELGGLRQIVGHDAVSLGGWDPKTGRRLWRLVPERTGDFNVPTPVVVDGHLLVATENNGARLYAFNRDGTIRPEPVAVNEDLCPDISTPVVASGLVFGNCGRLVCLDLAGGLRTCWESDEEDFSDYCSFIAGNGRVLVMSQTGKLVLVEADRSGLRVAGQLDLFDDLSPDDRGVWSHPALVGHRLYVRNMLGVYCFLLNSTD